MSKYQSLAEHLAARPGDEWNASFSELEAVLGFPLPKAARTGRAWWADDPARSHSRAWSAGGWQVGDIDHAAERVVFRRGAASGAALVQAAGLEPLPEAALDMPPGAPGASVIEKPARRALGPGVAVTAGLAVAAGLATALIRGVMRRR
jgi:hypothetical protein